MERAQPIALALAIWKRRKWLALLTFALPFSVVIGMVPFLPDVYWASAVVAIDPQQVPESFVRSTVTGGLELRLRTMGQEILSRARLADLITKFDLYPELRKNGVPAQQVVGRMRQDITVEFRGVDARASRGEALATFRVNYLGRDPVTAARVANALAAFYPQENTKVRERLSADTTEFIRRELGEVKTRLEGQERRVTEFKSRHLGETPQHTQANLTILDRISTQLRLNRDNQIRAADRREALSRELAAIRVQPEAEAEQPAAVRLARMKQELSELRTMFSDRYPDVLHLRARIATLEKSMAETPAPAATSGPPPAPDQSWPATPQALQLRRTLEAVEAEIRDLKLEERRLRDEAVTYERRLENTPRFELEFQRVSRDYDATSELYRSLLKRYEEAQLAETLEQRQRGEQFRVLEQASPSPPFAPRRGRLLLMGLVLSCGLAGAAVLLAEHLDTSFHRIDDLRAAAPVPVYRVPLLVTEADTKRWRLRFGVGAAATVAGMVLLFTASHLIATGRVPVVSDAVHSALVRM